MKYAASQDVDVLIVPINGEYGNMNALEAVELVNLVKPKLTIPSHFWTFIRHGSEPYMFDREMRLEANDCPILFYVPRRRDCLGWNSVKNGEFLKKWDCIAGQ